MKQLFNLITDKEKEVNYLKSQMKGNGNNINNQQKDNLIVESLQYKIVEINEDLNELCDLLQNLATYDKGHLVHRYYFVLS